MVVLTNCFSKMGSVHYLVCGKDYQIGRKDADILITNDESISRKHAVISVKPTEITLEDRGSKYSTFYNGRKLNARETIILSNNNEKIKFGVYNSEYMLEKLNFVTTGSSLNTQQKNKVRGFMRRFGGTFTDSWSPDCTHLTVIEVILTIKVLHALINEKPIVTVEFWDKVEYCILNNLVLPSVKDFQPPMAEALLNKTEIQLINPRRKKLFKGKTFMFPTDKLMSRMQEIIEKAGGSSICWNPKRISLPQINNVTDNYLFITSEDVDAVEPSLKSAYQELVKLGKRPIPVQEIAMAILYCSCEKDCNPNFNRMAQVFLKAEGDAGGNVALAAESQPDATNCSGDFKPKVEVIIPGTLEADLEISGPRKIIATSTEDKTDKMPQPTSGESGNINKRSNEADGNIPKRVKRESGASTSSVQKDNAPLMVTSSMNKRKATEDLPQSTPQKRVANPFVALAKKQSSSNNHQDQNNPFAVFKIKQEHPEKNNSPFLKILKKDTRETSNTTTVVKHENSNESSISRRFGSGHWNWDSLVGSVRMPLSQIKWISKSEAKDNISMIDESMKPIYEHFRNSLVIESKPNYGRRSGRTQEAAEVPSLSKRNFKRFVKLHPKRQPERVSVLFDSTTPLDRFMEGSGQLGSAGEDDEEPTEIIRPVTINRKSTGERKFFNF